MKNFDFIQLLAQHIPSFSKLHAYCDKAEIFQNSFPEESASNARKALEWLVKNHLAMTSANVEKKESLNDMLKRPEMNAFINYDWEFEKNIYTVKKFGNHASHISGQEIKKNDAFICLRALFYVVEGFLYRWKAIKSMMAFDATLIPQAFPGMQPITTDEPQVAPDVVDSVPKEVVDHPTKPVETPKESLASEAVTRR